MNPQPYAPLTLGQAIKAIAAAREAHSPEAVIVATMSAQFALDMIGEKRRRVDSVPLMGGASGIGLGIALSKPEVPVIVIDGDASLLMELGSLATVAHNRPKRYLHVLNSNGVQFNGLVNLPAVSSAPGVDFAAMARAAGYVHAVRIESLEALDEALPSLLKQQGPVFAELRIEPQEGRTSASTPQGLLPDLQFSRMRAGVRRLKEELAA